MRAMLAQSEKLASIGLLSAGRGPRDQQPAGLRRQQPRRARARPQGRPGDDRRSTSRPHAGAGGAVARVAAAGSETLAEDLDWPYVRENLAADARRGPARGSSGSPTSSRTSAGLARTSPPKMEPALRRRPARVGAGDGPGPAPAEPDRGRRRARRRAPAGLRRRADQPGDPQPAGQRHPGDRGGRTAPRAGGSGSRPRVAGTTVVLVDRATTAAGSTPELVPQALRPVLHHQAGRRGDRPGPLDQPRDRHRPRRPDRGREPPRRRDDASASSCP